jgi:hypothetical protein
MGIVKPDVDISRKSGLLKIGKGSFVSVFINFDCYEFSPCLLNENKSDTRSIIFSMSYPCSRIRIGVVSENLPPFETATYDVKQGIRCIYSGSSLHFSGSIIICQVNKAFMQDYP